MRFASPYPGYQLTAVHEQIEHLANGTTRIVKPGYIVRFRPGDWTVWERQALYDRFGDVIRRGQRMEDDMVTVSDSDWRIGTYDTSEIPNPDLRKQVEDALLGNVAHGHDYIMVAAPEIPAPWPNYPRLTAQGRRTADMVVEQIREKIVDLGIDPEQVAAYERTHLNRPEVTAMLDRLQADSDAPDVDAAIVVGA